jgi:vacuolar-type H+-ATPase subunit D/Vma8
MADVPLPGYQKFLKDKRTTLKAEHQSLVAKYPDAEAQLKQRH